eukprot:sb/3475720/
MSKRAALFLLVVLFQQQTITSLSVKAIVKEATGRTNRDGTNYLANNVLDNNVDTFYHSSANYQPQWLQLTLAEESRVAKVGSRWKLYAASRSEEGLTPKGRLESGTLCTQQMLSRAYSSLSIV